MKKSILLIILFSFSSAFGETPQRETPQVVVNIRPVHSLVQGVLGDTAKAHLLIEKGSPHYHQLKPSDVLLLHDSNLFIYIDDAYDSYIKDTIKSIENTEIFPLSKLDTLLLLPTREIGERRYHDKHGDDEHRDHDKHEDDEHRYHDKHGDDEHRYHDKHGDDEHRDHDKHGDDEHRYHDKHGDDEHRDHDKHGDDEHRYHDKHGDDEHRDHDKHGDDEHRYHDKHGDDEHRYHDKHGDDEHHDHAHGTQFDLHFWLSPKNAQAIVHAVSQRLGVINPSQKTVYEQNAKKLIKRLQDLDVELYNSLHRLSKTPYLIFHDAYQYFENHYNLRGNAGSIFQFPRTFQSVSRLQALTQVIEEQGIKCIFSEPQFSNRTIETLVEDQPAIKVTDLDPLGDAFLPSEDLYFQMMRQLAHQYQNCLQ